MRRIFGLETEFGIAFAAGTGRRLGPEEVARDLFAPVVEWGRSSNVFLGNGARLYLDVGSHPEYATAECDNLNDLIAQDEAGTAIVAELAARAQRALAANGNDGRIHLIKNNVDSQGNSYGSHENFLLRRTTQFDLLTTALLPFLVTRQLIVGAGAIIPSTPNFKLSPAQTCAPPSLLPPHIFGLSARSDVMWEGVSSATTRSRPIINARDEPHADAALYRRMHVIVGDSSMLQTTTELKVGSAGLVLDLIETGVPLGDYTLRHPIRDIRHVARDITGATPIELQSGKTLTAREVQEVYCTAATRLVDRGDHSLGDDETARRVVSRWSRMLTALATDTIDTMATEIDWVCKRQLVLAASQRHSCKLIDPRIARVDIAYHDITQGAGLLPKLTRSGLAQTVVDPATVEHAKEHPPATTRAQLRGRFVNAARAARKDYTVDWVHLRLHEDGARAAILRDPFATRDERALDLIADLGGDPEGPKGI